MTVAPERPRSTGLDDWQSAFDLWVIQTAADLDYAVALSLRTSRSHCIPGRV